MSRPRNPKGRAKLGCLPLGNPQVCLLNEVKEVNVSSQLTSLTSMESVRGWCPSGHSRAGPGGCCYRAQGGQAINTSSDPIESYWARPPVAMAGLPLEAAAIGPRVSRQLIPAVTP